MKAEGWSRVGRLFEELADLAEDEQRRCLESVGCAHPQLASLVGRLLEADRRAGRILEPLSEWSPLAPDDVPSIDNEIDGYRLLGLLGRGGMGAVYLAVRKRESSGVVALKLLPAGIDQPRALARFDREGRMLARLRHPHIARLFEHGTTTKGRPFLALEYVEGDRIDEHCRRLDLPVDERLELFLQLCSAVDHAHRHELVHRDIKPSNVLVTDQGQVKLLDFGIAKPLSSDSFFGALETSVGQRPMSPLYASPEQLRGLTVGPASDVYSLGVLLYRLLTDRVPYGDVGASALERAICEVDPKPPSHFVGGGLDGDVDRIVLKALRKEVGRRYRSVAALVADLERYLARRPIHRHLEHVLYRAYRTLGRHRAILAGFVLTVLALAGAAKLVELRSERVAMERQRSMQSVKNMAAFLATQSREAGATGEAERLLMIRSFQRLACRLQGQPEAEIEMVETTAALAREAGMPDLAWAALVKGVELRRQHAPGQWSGLAGALQEVGEVYLDLADGAAALVPLREALVLRGRGGAHDEEVASSLEALGEAEHAVWWLDDARIHLRAAIGLTPGDDAAARVRRQRKLANLYRDRRELRAAATLLRDVGNDAAAHLAPGHPEAVAVLLAKAELHRLSGDLSAAEARYRDALPHFEEGAFSAGSAAFAALRGLAETVALQGRSDAAEGLVQEGLRRARERASAGFEVARFLGELGRLEVRKGDLATAAALQREALDLLERWLGSAHWEVGHARLELARIAQRQGQSEVALVELGRSARILSRTLAPGHPARSALRRALHETRGAHLARPGVLELHGFDELLQPALFMSVPERWRRSPAI